MTNPERIVRYTVAEIDEMLRRGESRTDWARVDAMTEEELEASIDYEEEGEFDLSTLQPGIPGPTRPVTLHLDVEVIEWFEAQSVGSKWRMSNVLRDFVAAQKAREAATASTR